MNSSALPLSQTCVWACVCVCELEDAGVTDSVLIFHAVPGLHVTMGGGESQLRTMQKKPL